MTTEDRWVYSFTIVAITAILTIAVCHYRVTKMELESKERLAEYDRKPSK
jgi:hypothetical protein